MTLSKGDRVVVETPAGRVVLTVVQVKAGSVRLGFEAPAGVPVHRKEVHEAIEWREGRHA